MVSVKDIANNRYLYSSIWEIMLVFIIPLKSKKVSNSWNAFLKLYKRTLHSVTNQTDSNYRIITVCHEIPDMDFQHENLEYVVVDFPVPQLTEKDQERNIALKEADKAQKILKGVEVAEKYNPDYIMVVDADDCISNRIVRFVSKHGGPDIPGWYFKKGLFYSEGKRFLMLNKENFNTLCGTCTILKPHLIPQMIDKETELIYKHRRTRFEDGSELQPFPMVGSIYSMANGENHFMSTAMIQDLNKGNPLSMTFIKGIFRKLRKYRVQPLTKKLKQEFGLYTIGDA